MTSNTITSMSPRLFWGAFLFLCFLFPPVNLIRKITSTLIHSEGEVLLPLDVTSQSKNEKLIWLRPRVAWRMLLKVNIKKRLERQFILEPEEKIPLDRGLM